MRGQPQGSAILGAQHLPKSVPKFQTQTLVVRLKVLPRKDTIFMVPRPYNQVVTPTLSLCPHSQGCFSEAAFLCGLQFPVHPFIHELLGHLKIAHGQLVPNAWRTIVSCMSIWKSIREENMIKLNKFLFLYHLKPLTTMGIFSFIRGIGNLELFVVILLPLVTGSQGTSLSMEKIKKLLLMKFRARCPYCCVSGRFPHLVRVSLLMVFTSYTHTHTYIYSLFLPFLFVASTCPGLKSRYQG